MERFCHFRILKEKKQIVAYTAILLFLLHFSFTAEAKYDFTVNGFYYRVVSLQEKTCALINEREGENEIPVSRYRGDIVVPSTVTIGPRTFTVVEIGECAFYYSKITSIKVPGTVKVIGRSAFSQCEYLQSIEIKDGVEVIGNNAFLRCGREKTIKKIILPTSKIKSIGKGAFEDIRIDKTANAIITIPSSCMVVGKDAFKNGEGYRLVIEDSKTPLTVYDDGLCSGATSIYVGRNIEYKLFDYFERTGRIGLWRIKTIKFGDWVTSVPKCEEHPASDSEKDTLVFGKSIRDLPQIVYKPIGYIQINAVNPPEMGGFDNNVYLNSVLIVPEGAMGNYKNDPNWGKFWDIRELTVSKSVQRTDFPKASPSVHVTVGAIIFDDSFIQKSISNSSVYWTEEERTNTDGYTIRPSHGGDLIPFIYQPSGKVGFVDRQGRMVVEPKYDDYLYGDYSELLLVPVFVFDKTRMVMDDYGYMEESYGLGFINMKGEQVVPCLYDTIYGSSDSMPELVEINGAWPLKTKGENGPLFGVINKAGKTLVPFDYEGFNENEDGTVSFFKGRKEYIYDKSWKIEKIL